MLEPSSPAPVPPPEPFAPAPAPAEGRALALIEEVRAAQTRALRQQGLFFAVSAFLVLAFSGGLLATTSVLAGRVLLFTAPIVAAVIYFVVGVVLPRRRVGDRDRTARLLADRAPELSLDLLSAVEVSRAMGRRDDFSPDLARAFLRDVDARAAKRPAASLIDQKPVRRAGWTLFGVGLAAFITLGMAAEHLVSGVLRAFSSAEVTTIRRREPITGDFRLAYRYPEYTGLEPRSVEGTAGEVAGPAGTEVVVTTRADRDVDEAALIVNGTKVPLTVKGRELSGSFVLDATGQYHVAFLDGADVEVEGPDLPIQVEVDAAPQVRLQAPIDTLELDPKTRSVTLQYEASDDYGLTGLDLVFKSPGAEERRVPLKLGTEARADRGTYAWDVGALGLKPGAEVRYFVEARDGNTVKGAQKGVSKTQVLKLYSAAEHRRDALKRAEALWEQLVTHLADRQEAPERKTPLTLESLGAGAAIDQRASLLATSFAELADSLSEEKEPLPDLVAALTIIGSELETDTRSISQRRTSLKNSAQLTGRSGSLDSAFSFALTSRLSNDLSSSEKNVLYLEALLDRARLDAIRDLASQLKEDRRELTRLVEQLQKSNDPAVRDELLEQMNQLKARMEELQQRMSELAKGIRDDFMNQDALQQMQEERNLGDPLEEIERLVREGKNDEALKKMQELSMKLDEMLEGIERGAEEADENADPELARDFEEFSKSLQETVTEQERVAKDTQALKDKARQAAKERISQRGEQVKRELERALQTIEQSYQSLPPTEPGLGLQERREKAMNAVRNTKEALAANDFDLAAESARDLAEQAGQLERVGLDQYARDRAFQNPDEMVRESKKLAERLARDARTANEVSRKLDELFPPASQSLSPPEQQQLKDLAKQQQKLGEQGESLKQQMQSLGERAPLFDEDAQRQMDQATQRMRSAGQELSMKNPDRGHGEQQGALQSLRGLQQSLENQQQQQGGGKGKGLPMPMRRGGKRMGSGQKDQKIEIPDEDPSANPREFRKDVMDAMKQGAPDRYKEQNKKYYEELVK